MSLSKEIYQSSLTRIQHNSLTKHMKYYRIEENPDVRRPEQWDGKAAERIIAIMTKELSRH